MDNLRLPSREEFENRLQEAISKKKTTDNINYFDDELYKKFIKEAKEAKTKRGTSKLARRFNRFAVVTVGEKERLIAPLKAGQTKMRFFVRNSELFDILMKAHLDLNHGRRNRMFEEVKKDYKNVSVEAINIFLELCGACLGKKKTKRRGLTVKPMVFNAFNDRTQVDLIDFQSSPDGQFRFIMVVQDHLTKFVHLRALSQKTAVAVAESLLPIFLEFGAPVVLQSDNGREFANAVVEALCDIWPGMKIVHGKPRHSQSQGSVERANQDIQNMLNAWMITNRTNKWAEGLKWVASSKNRAVHEGTGRSPYEALFGMPMRQGISSVIPER